MQQTTHSLQQTSNVFTACFCDSMSPSDCRHGSHTQTDHTCDLHTCDLHTCDLHTCNLYACNLHLTVAENCGKRFIRTLYDFQDTNKTGNRDVKRAPPKNPWSFPKGKMFGFLIGLMLSFLMMASYVLMWDRKGLLITDRHSQTSPTAILTSSTTAAAEVSSEENSVDMKWLVKIIGSKLEYTPRKVPDKKEVLGTDSHLSVLPHHFLPGIKSPCWYQEFSGEVGTDPYKKNLFSLRSKIFKASCNRLRTNFHQHLLHRGGKQFRLRCLPFFYIIGQPKCGTTDLYNRLLLHPEIKFNTMKEPHWWTRRRFGYIRFKDGLQERVPVEDYLDLFDLAAHNIHEGISGNSSGDHRLSLITGEASASTLWDHQAWFYVHKEREETEPLFLTQDFIHAVQPDAKIILILRDPVERLYSDYLYFKMANKSVEDFHQSVVDSVRLFQSCLSERSIRFCVYDAIFFNAMPVRLTLGMYVIFLLDWLTVFQREQILVVRLEDYAANLKETIKKVFDFLNVGPMSQQVEAALIKQPKSNTRRIANSKLGTMLQATRDLLREFYQPFNHKLASVLANEAFLWRNT